MESKSVQGVELIVNSMGEIPQRQFVGDGQSQ